MTEEGCLSEYKKHYLCAKYPVAPVINENTLAELQPA